MFTDPIKKLAKLRNQAGQGFSEYSLLLMLVVVAGGIIWRIFGDRLVAFVSNIIGSIF